MSAVSSVSEVASEIKELKSINAELKKLNKQCKDLRILKGELEATILEYLESTDQPGVKCQNIVAMIDNKKKSTRRTDKDKIDCGTKVLSRYGIRDTEKVLKELMSAMKSESSNVTCLKLQESDKTKK